MYQWVLIRKLPLPERIVGNLLMSSELVLLLLMITNLTEKQINPVVFSILAFGLMHCLQFMYIHYIQPHMQPLIG